MTYDSDPHFTATSPKSQTKVSMATGQNSQNLNNVYQVPHFCPNFCPHFRTNQRNSNVLSHPITLGAPTSNWLIPSFLIITVASQTQSETPLFFTVRVSHYPTCLRTFAKCKWWGRHSCHSQVWIHVPLGLIWVVFIYFLKSRELKCYHFLFIEEEAKVQRNVIFPGSFNKCS